MEITIIEAQNKEQKSRRRVAAYARVSTAKDEQFSSYESQISYYTRYIQSHEDWVFAGLYTDAGISATSTHRRRGFKQMLKDALDGRIDLIVTKSLSRFARNTVDSLTTIRKLKDAGCECFFEKENIFTFDSKGELLLTIMSSLAQEESRSISSNVSWGIKESMRKGRAYVPYSVFLGYDKGPRGEMRLKPKEAVLVRRIYGLYLQGLSPYRIAKLLTDEGVPSPASKELWFATTIASILKNEKYKGDALRQKTYIKDYLSKERIVNSGEVQQYYIKGHHEAIVTEAVFDKVQKELARRGCKSGELGWEEMLTGSQRCDASLDTGRKHPFSQRIRCAACGKFFGPKTWHPRTKSEKLMWICNNKYRKAGGKRKAPCDTPCLSEDQLQGFFVSAMQRLFSDDALAQSIFNNIKSRKLNIEGLLAEKECLEYELAQVQAQAEALELARAGDPEHAERLHVSSSAEGDASKYISRNPEEDAKNLSVSGDHEHLERLRNSDAPKQSERVCVTSKAEYDSQQRSAISSEYAERLRVAGKRLQEVEQEILRAKQLKAEHDALLDKAYKDGKRLYCSERPATFDPARQEPISQNTATFDPALWEFLVSSMTIHSDASFTISFKDKTALHITSDDN